MAEINALWRHPIKGHGREALDRMSLTEGQTIPWDRRWAVTREMTKSDGTAWAPCANYSRGSKLPGLMAINAHRDEASTTANPATGAHDLHTLGALAQHHYHQHFGIYAVVTHSGDIAVGDEITLS